MILKKWNVTPGDPAIRFQSTFPCNLRQIEIYDNEHNQEGKVSSFLPSATRNDQFYTILLLFHPVVTSSGALIQ